VCKDREPRKEKNVTDLEKKKAIEKVNGQDNSTDSKNMDLDKRAIHIHGGMEHNLVRYAKYYSCGSIEITRSNEFTKDINHSKRDFSRYW
jgi:hypothetical protein